MKKGIICFCFYSTVISILCLVLCFSASAKEAPITITGSLYEFAEKANYEYSSAANSVETNGSNAFGTFRILSDAKNTGVQNGFDAYSVDSQGIQFFYSFNRTKLKKDETEWHITEDKSKNVDGFSLDDNILSGAVIVRTSNNGTDWVLDTVRINVFAEDSDFFDAFYTTKDIQLQNGCYYQVIVIYELQRKNEGKNEKKKIAEVYEFYAISSEIEKHTANAFIVPRKELGQKINTGQDNGYSENIGIEENDPHYGWDLGTFVINGYTSETSDNGTPVFLKNVSDKVTLWFTLKQDINQLNGDKSLSISEDVDGYDQSFEVPKTNFKRGALIIRFTDHEGKKHEPVIYTDFLAANATTSADTRVQLFEEGDYEISLDYEIRNDPRKIGPISVVPTYTNYKISFHFSIRNGNCMVYPFDQESGNELANNAISAKGFKLDMAKSRYLKINMKQIALNIGSNGLVTEDIRFNGPVKDGASYTETGIYKFTVKNLYTDEETEKTFYVGEDNKYISALAKNLISTDVLNEKIAQGWTIEEDGTITEPVPVSEPEPDSSEQEELTSSKPQPTVSVTPPAEEEEEHIPVSAEVEDIESEFPTVWGVCGAIALVLVSVSAISAIMKRRNKKKGGGI